MLFTVLTADVLPRLSPRQRDVVELHLKGKDIPEIAQLLSISRGSVGGHLSKAREKAEEMIEASGGRERCPCGLLLPCHDCTGRAEDYLRFGAEGGAAFSGWRAIR